MAGPFVGRERELALLADTVRAEDSEGPSVALVTGEPGCGKSRLLSEAGSRLGGEQWLEVVGYEPEQRVPLAGARALLEVLVGLPEHGAQLEAILFGASVDRTTLEPLRVFEAAYRAFRSLPAPLLVVDDLQWLDELSTALCHYLIRASQAARRPLAVLAASRPSPTAAAFAESLARVLPPSQLTMLELGALERTAGIRLALALTPALDAAAAAELWQKAGGSPFWLEALVRTGGAEADAGLLVTARLRGASGGATALLALLAVAARPLTRRDVTELKRWSAGRVEAAAGELVARGIATESGNTIGLLHDLIRAAALREVPTRAKRQLHTRLAAHLEAEADGELHILREALEHRRAAGLPAVGLARQLARSPSRALLGSDGLEELSTIAREADGNDDAVLDLHRALASFAAELGEYARALEHWSLLAEQAPSVPERAAANLECSKAALNLTRAAQARAFLAHARAAAPSEPHLAVALEAQDALILSAEDPSSEEARRLATRAAAAGRQLAAGRGGAESLEEAERRAYLDALAAESLWAGIDDRWPDVVRIADETAAAARGFDVSAYLEALVFSANSLWTLGRVHEAAERTRRAWNESRRLVLPVMTIRSGTEFAWLLHDIGLLTEAEAVRAETADLAARLDNATEAPWRPRYERSTFVLAATRGDWAQATGDFERWTESWPQAHHRIASRQYLAQSVARVRGKAAASAVVSQLEKAFADAVATACPHCSLELRLFAAEALVRIGESERARRLLAEWEAGTRDAGPIDALRRRRIEPLLALADDDVQAGIALLEDVIAEAERLGLAVEALWAGLDLGRALAGLDRRRSAETLRRVAERAGHMGARTPQQLAEQALRRLGVRTWRRGAASPSDPSGLTSRELEVARRAATGATNPEIAQALFLSRKTVERHVSNALAKLGVRNRTELARALAGVHGTDEGAPSETEGVPR